MNWRDVLNESTTPSANRTPPPAFWPPLLLLGVLALLGVGAIVWLVYATLEQAASREIRQAELVRHCRENWSKSQADPPHQWKRPLETKRELPKLNFSKP